MRPRRRPPPPPSPSPAPAPATAPSPASRSRDASASSPPSPYAALAPGHGPGPAPEPSAAGAVATGGGRRVGASLSPPLIAMLAVVGAALLVVLYARLVSRVFRAARRRWRRRWLRLLMLPGGSGGGFSPSTRGGGGGGDDSFASFTTYDNHYHTFSPYCGLDESAIKSLPSAQYLAAVTAARGSGASRECAVCLLEFADGDELRALPLCAHAFHADCIDVWLRADASCPLCRAAVALPLPVPSPLHRGARRVRPSLDDLLFFHPVPPLPPDGGATGAAGTAHEIAPASPDQQQLGAGARDFLLKRSYSFGFERSLAVEAASTASPTWRFRISAAGATWDVGRVGPASDPGAVEAATARWPGAELGRVAASRRGAVAGRDMCEEQQPWCEEEEQQPWAMVRRVLDEMPKRKERGKVTIIQMQGHPIQA